MDFIEELKKLVADGEKAHNEGESLNEATTISWFIDPFIYQLLGYGRQEIKREYPAISKQDRVDIAIFIDDSPTIFFECKALGVTLGKQEWEQLRRYFNACIDVRFGVLTNGLRYKFYTDLNDTNLMDDEPFLEFDLSNIQEPLVEELQRFSKANFNADTIISRAQELIYTRGIKRILAEEYDKPTDDFLDFCIKKYKQNSQRVKKEEKEEFRGPVQQAFHEFVSEHSAPADTAESDNEPVAPEPSTPQVSDELEWQPLSELSPQSRDPSPTNILFPDNSQVSIKSWNAMLVEIASWLEKKKLLDADHCPLLAGATADRYIISTDPKHSDDKPFTAKREIGARPLYIETNWGIPYIFKNTIRIIEHVGQDPAQFKVRFPV